MDEMSENSFRPVIVFAFLVRLKTGITEWNIKYWILYRVRHTIYCFFLLTSQNVLFLISGAKETTQYPYTEMEIVTLLSSASVHSSSCAHTTRCFSGVMSLSVLTMTTTHDVAKDAVVVAKNEAWALITTLRLSPLDQLHSKVRGQLMNLSYLNFDFFYAQASKTNSMILFRTQYSIQTFLMWCFINGKSLFLNLWWIQNIFSCIFSSRGGCGQDREWLLNSQWLIN